MKNKKKLLIAGASAASLVALGLGTFAFFTDTLELPVINTKVGTVDISATAEVRHTQLKRDLLHKYPYDIYATETDGDFLEYWEVPDYPDWRRENPGPVPVLVDSNSSMTKTMLQSIFEEAPDNLNPGDNLGGSYNNTNHEDLRPGTDHEIILNITNEGSKSTDIRVLFEVSGKDANGVDLTAEELQLIRLFIDTENSVSGLTSLYSRQAVPSDIHYSLYSLNNYESSQDDDKSIKYELTPNVVNFWTDDFTNTSFGQVFLDEHPSLLSSHMVLSGNPSHYNVETEKETFSTAEESYDSEGHIDYNFTEEIKTIPYSGTLKIDVGMEAPYDYRGNFDEDMFETLQKLQGADIKIKIIVQAMQHRNSSYDMWDTVFTDMFEF